MNRVIKKYCIHIALCWLAVLLSVFLTPGLSVRAVETVNNGAEPEASEASGQAQPEYGSLDELTGKKIGMITGFDTVLKGTTLFRSYVCLLSDDDGRNHCAAERPGGHCMCG